MTVDQLRAFHQAQPFRPFFLHIADGRTISVHHPEFMAYAGGRTVFVGQPDESFEVVDVLMITSIEVRNGRNSKRKVT